MTQRKDIRISAFIDLDDDGKKNTPNTNNRHGRELDYRQLAEGAMNTHRGIKGLRILGNAIRQRRRDLGFSREDIARALQVNTAWLILLENGSLSRKEIDDEKLNTIADCLKVEPSALRILSLVTE